MPGNEKRVYKYLLKNIDKISLKYIGVLTEIGTPNYKDSGYAILSQKDDLDKVAAEDSGKKADIYLNGIGVSIKQKGGNFAYNRLQKAEIKNFFIALKLENPKKIINKIDNAVNKFHQGKLTRRNRPWQDFFSENNFKLALKYLMLKGSLNKGISLHPAKLILEAPASISEKDKILMFTFNEYFNKYKNKFKISIRRQWIGQASDSEHKRSLGLYKKKDNRPWIFNDVSGAPRGWREDWPKENRKTVYFLMIEKEK